MVTIQIEIGDEAYETLKVMHKVLLKKTEVYIKRNKMSKKEKDVANDIMNLSLQDFLRDVLYTGATSIGNTINNDIMLRAIESMLGIYPDKEEEEKDSSEEESSTNSTNKFIM